MSIWNWLFGSANRTTNTSSNRSPFMRQNVSRPHSGAGRAASLGNGHSRNGRPQVGRHQLRHRPQPKVFGCDRVCAVGFHDRAFVISRPADPSDPLLHDRMNTLDKRIGGTGTNLTDAIAKAVDLLETVPPGYLRRVKLITDGVDNRDCDGLWNAVQRAYDAHINIDVIPIGGDGCTFNFDRLRGVASKTHNGKVIGVSRLKELADALKYTAGNARPGQHRAEVTCLAIDLSPSMTEMWDRQRKIDAVMYSIRRLLTIKQKLA